MPADKHKASRWVLALAILLMAGSTASQGAAQGDLVAVVHASNSVDTVDASDLRNYYLGRSKFWDSNVLVRPYARPPSTNAGRGLFKLLKMTPSRYRHHWQSLQLAGRGTAPREVRSASGAIGAVAGDRGGITVVTASEAGAARSHGSVKVVPIR